MPGLIKLITGPPTSETRTAEVVSQGYGNTYVVRLGSRTLVVQSALDATLPRGARVVIAQKAGKNYIVGRETPGSRQIKRVTVRG
jgi:hypothetical protein